MNKIYIEDSEGSLMAKLIKKYKEDIDLLYLKVDRNYEVYKTIDFGDVIIDIDNHKKLVSAELLQASIKLNVSENILNDDFEIQVNLKSERSDIIMDMTFSFLIDNRNVYRHIHSKLNNPYLIIPSQDLVVEKA